MPLKLCPPRHKYHTILEKNYLIRTLLSVLGRLRYNTAPTTTTTTPITSNSSSSSTTGIATAAATFTINAGVGVGVTVETSDSYVCTHKLHVQYLNCLLER